MRGRRRRAGFGNGCRLDDPTRGFGRRGRRGRRGDGRHGRSVGGTGRMGGAGRRKRRDGPSLAVWMRRLPRRSHLGALRTDAPVGRSYPLGSRLLDIRPVRFDFQPVWSRNWRRRRRFTMWARPMLRSDPRGRQRGRSHGPAIAQPGLAQVVAVETVDDDVAGVSWRARDDHAQGGNNKDGAPESPSRRQRHRTLR